MLAISTIPQESARSRQLPMIAPGPGLAFQGRRRPISLSPNLPPARLGGNQAPRSPSGAQPKPDRSEYHASGLALVLLSPQVRMGSRHAEIMLDRRPRVLR